MNKRSLLFIGASLMLALTPAVSQTINPDFQDGKVMFQVKQNSNLRLPVNADHTVIVNKVEFLKNISEKYSIKKIVQKHPTIKSAELRLVYEIDFGNMADADNLVRDISSSPYIQYAEKKVLPHLYATTNDPYSTSAYMWHIYKVKANLAWDITMGSSSIVVAVLDNAMYTNHPDLTNKLTTTGSDVADNDSDVNPPTLTDSNWDHGTHTTGTVGAETNNSKGVSSIGYDIKVMPVKIARNSDGALIAGYDGIVYAVDNGAKVISMSWGSGTYSTYGQQIIDYAYSQNVVCVAAAGNAGVSTVEYPGGYTHVIAVASSASNDAKSSFSNYGTWIDVTSPGENILSTTATDAGGTGIKYGYMDGTSMATPLVAGLCGLMLSVNSNMLPDDLEACLKTNCDNIDSKNPSYIGKLGGGRINAQKAVQCVQATMSSLDAGVKSLVAPGTGNVCAASITPIVELHNFGTTALTSATIKYQIDGGALSSYNWIGNLATSSSTNVTLPAIGVSVGTHTLNAYTTSPNAGTDANAVNDASTQTFTVITPLSIPFSEGFEGSFPPAGWYVYNPDAAYTFAKTSAAAKTGSSCTWMRNFDYNNSVGQHDDLTLPALNLTGVTNMTFDLSYVAYDATYEDTLQVWISTDCGNNYTTIYDKTGQNLATKSPWSQTSAYTPASGSDWRTETIDLSAYSTASSAILLFWHKSGWGNNLYIDNVNITNSTTGVKTVNSKGNVKIYPNPTEDILNISFSDNSFNESTVTVYNMLGSHITTLAGNTLAQTNKIDLSTYTKGVYFVEISSKEGKQIQKVVLK